MYLKINVTLISWACVSYCKNNEMEVIDNVNNFRDHLAIKCHITFEAVGVTL